MPRKKPELDPVNVRFGKAVERARVARGWSYRVGAAELELALSHMQALEAGKLAIGLPLAVRLAKKLELSIDKLGRL